MWNAFKGYTIYLFKCKVQNKVFNYSPCIKKSFLQSVHEGQFFESQSSVQSICTETQNTTPMSFWRMLTLMIICGFFIEEYN